MKFSISKYRESDSEIERRSMLNSYVYEYNYCIKHKKEFINFLREFKDEINVPQIIDWYVVGCMNEPHTNRKITTQTRWLLKTEFLKDYYQLLLDRKDWEFGRSVNKWMREYI